MRRSRGKSERGFTLVEVLASVVIISIVLIGVVNLLIFTNKTAVSNNDKLVAINLAKASIDHPLHCPRSALRTESFWIGS